MPRGDHLASKQGARLDPAEADRLALALERQALTLLRLRGAKAAQRSQPPLDPELYDQAVGVLNRAARLRGETPVAILARLGITGYRRRRLLADTGGTTAPRWRKNAQQRHRALTAKRTPGPSVGNDVLDQRRAAVLGLTVGSLAWQRLIAADRAFERRMEQRRLDCLPIDSDTGRVIDNRSKR